MESPKLRTKRSKFLLVGISLLVILAAAAAVYYPRFKKQWSAPLGPALELPTHTPPEPVTAVAAAADTQAPAASPTAGGNGTIAPTEPTAEAVVTTVAVTPTNNPTPTAQPMCGGPATEIILAIGADNDDESYQYGLADVIRVARVDFVTPKVTVLTIPRDLWVEIPDISAHYGITHGKLNQAYFYGNPGMSYYDGPGAGPGLLARTLDLNFGLQVNHYGAINMATFAKIIDAVGGIDLKLPYDVDGTPVDANTEDMGYFYAGNNHMTGIQALHFARIRKRYNDFTRQQFQNWVLCALRKKLLTPAVLPKIPQIISAFKDSINTDLSLEQISQMACLLPKLDKKNIILTSFPQDIFKQSRVFSPQQKDTTFVLDVDYDILRSYIDQFVAGTWPTAKESDQPSCE